MGRRDFDLGIVSKQFDTSELRVMRIHASERISEPYTVEVDVACPSGSPLDLDEVAGAEATATLEDVQDRHRRFHGIISRVLERPALDAAWTPYRLELRPRLWQGSLVEMLDVFLDASIPEIVEKKLALFGLVKGEDFELRLAGSYPRREFVVQFKESDLAFCARLLEHLGIFYFFEHEEQGERLIIGDGRGAYHRIGGGDAIHYNSRGDEVGVFDLSLRRELVPRQFVCRDYNDQTPALELQAKHELEEGFAGGVIEYGSDFRSIEQGEQLVRVRAEERLAQRDIFEGQSDDARLAAGHLLDLDDHPRHSGSLLLVSVDHEAHQPIVGHGAGGEKSYVNRFVAIPGDRTYRPPRQTPIPRVHGLLTGIIETGQGDIETYAKLDEQGRYTVRLLFDTSAPGERKASCPIRMLQPSAGPGYGVHFPLKPGVEVSIGFVDGNPDRPIIVGAAPNPITPAPVTAATGTKSRILTRSGILIEFEDSVRRA
jgi:type VI secretion system secreted protein VgrG